MQTPHYSKTPNSLQNVLRQSRFSTIVQKAHRHQAIDDLLKYNLERDLQPHCRVAQLKDTTLVVHINNSAWLTRFNYCKPTLIKALQASPLLCELRAIKCKVKPFD